MMMKNEKIIMKNAVAEMDGDEMTRVIWQLVKDELICPYIDLKTEYFDLGMTRRDETDDKVTYDAAEATGRLGVGVKCATITPNAARVDEYKLRRMYPSPNATIRGILGGTVFRTPITAPGIKRYIPTWIYPITIARHAYGDIYKNTEALVPAGGRAELVVTAPDGGETRRTIFDYKDGGGIAQGIHNTDKSIEAFAVSCFEYALSERKDLWFSSKDTISKIYDHRFKDIFAELYEGKYKQKFEAAGINYYYMLIDDAAARVIRSQGGFIWACKNYDGDVMSDLLAACYGCLSMMTSVLVSPDGTYEYEAAHGTVQRHYYKYIKGERTSTNSVATIFAWTGALRRRGQLDMTPALIKWADDMEAAVMKTIADGKMTGDLLAVSDIDGTACETAEFIREIKSRYDTITAE